MCTAPIYTPFMDLSPKERRCADSEQLEGIYGAEDNSINSVCENVITAPPITEGYFVIFQSHLRNKLFA